MPKYSNLGEIIHDIRHFNRFYTNLIGLLSRYRFDSTYTLAEARVILEIGINDKYTITTLKEILKIDAGYLSRIVKRLIKSGIVEIEKSPSDNRINLLSLTKKGRQTLDYINQMSDRQVENIIENLSLDDLTKLISHMKSIETILGKK